MMIRPDDLGENGASSVSFKMCIQNRLLMLEIWLLEAFLMCYISAKSPFFPPHFTTEQ